MKMPRPFRPKDMPRGRRSAVRSRSEAAVLLVRLEYERARLEREQSSHRARSLAAAHLLTAVEDRIEGLAARLISTRR